MVTGELQGMVKNFLLRVLLTWNDSNAKSHSPLPNPPQAGREPNPPETKLPSYGKSSNSSHNKPLHYLSPTSLIICFDALACMLVIAN